MSVQYLTDANFSNPGGRVLRCNIPGIAFVMFKTDNCEHCQQTTPIFNQLSQQDMRLTWAIVDVGKFRNLVGMAKMSHTPIRAVPMFILYVDGRPHANYKGKRTSQNIIAFLNKILESLNTSNQSFSQPVTKSPSNPYPQPEYQPQQQQQMPQTDEFQHAKNVIPYNAPYMAYKSMRSM